MILLFDDYNEQALQLHTSVLAAGVPCKAFACIDNGFLPSDVISPYREICGMSGADIRPRYFDRVRIPAGWEIRDIGGSAEIWDFNRLRARITYADPKYRRFISSVHWLDENRKQRSIDHYDWQGMRFAETVCDDNGKMVLKRYFDAGGNERILENFASGILNVKNEEKELFFKNRTEFISWYLREQGLAGENMMYNSLSTPFFVSECLGDWGFNTNDVLYWWENMPNGIPGNMKGILLNQTSRRTRQIFVRTESSVEELVKAGVNPSVYQRLGYVPPFIQENAGGRNVLIMTNSDQVERLEEITSAFPALTFHVAAITAMSNKLLAFSRKENVRLYPNIKPEETENLFKTCAYYLDINRGNEIQNAVWRAFLCNQVILGFKETCHRQEYIPPENLYSLENTKELIDRLKEVSEDQDKRHEAVIAQQNYAKTETPESFREAMQPFFSR